MLQNYYPERTEVELNKLFGSGFSHKVFTLEAGKWHGPILSGYGTHIVYVHSKSESGVPDFETVADIVKEDWQKEKLEELNEVYLKGLMSRYEIIIEKPETKSLDE
jgi:parvulin-like peptidyl-prolyl isomerase